MLKRVSWLLMLLAALAVAAPVFAEGPSGLGAASLNSSTSVSGTTVTLTGATGRNVRIYGIWAFCVGGTGTLYITDSTNTVALWRSISGAVGTSQYSLTFNPTPFFGPTGASLTVSLASPTIGASSSCELAQRGHIEVQADRY